VQRQGGDEQSSASARIGNDPGALRLLLKVPLPILNRQCPVATQGLDDAPGAKHGPGIALKTLLWRI
jgi:hypothetical protein